jgi:hypothetical protein
MTSKRSHEGYLMIDHREVDSALPPGTNRLIEVPTYTCSHCQTVVVLNPQRTRERAYCSGCDHYLCDSCGTIKNVTGKCRTFKQIMDEVQENAVRQEQSIILL